MTRVTYLQELACSLGIGDVPGVVGSLDIPGVRKGPISLLGVIAVSGDSGISGVQGVAGILRIPAEEVIQFHYWMSLVFQ